MIGPDGQDRPPFEEEFWDRCRALLDAPPGTRIETTVDGDHVGTTATPESWADIEIWGGGRHREWEGSTALCYAIADLAAVDVEAWRRRHGSTS